VNITILLFLFLTPSNAFLSKKSLHKRLKCINLSEEEIDKIDAELMNENVRYLDLSSPTAASQQITRNLPLFLLGSSFYPEGVTFLNIFEMKYR
jgi:hypothetical protein